MDTTDTYAPQDEAPKKSFFKKFKKPGKQFFWAWVAYQAVKGTLTTSLIWIPLIYAWFQVS